jgi:hypothetical protein
MNGSMKWIDDNNLEGEMSDSDFSKKIEEETKTRNIQTHGRDGNFQVFEKKFCHRGLYYFVKVIRYYQISVSLKEISGMNKIGKWAVLEYDKSIKNIVDFISQHQDFFEYYEFLYADTLHSHNENQTLKQMFEEMKKQGQKDIDWFFDEADKQFEKKFEELKALQEQIKQLQDTAKVKE